MLALLSRAHGLDLLKPGEWVAEHTELRDTFGPLALGESHQGFDLLQEKPTRVVLVTDEVFYPQPGWSFRKEWEDDKACGKLTMGRDCAFPMACACYG
jgi:hypothetical protein